jgi:beta-aspartyl-peptidase (threonine type)
MSAEDAARAATVLLEERGRGHGGLVLVDARGRYGFARSTASMSWAAITSTGEASGY